MSLFVFVSLFVAVCVAIVFVSLFLTRSRGHSLRSCPLALLTSNELSNELINDEENSTGVWGTKTRDLGCSSLDPPAPMLLFFLLPFFCCWCSAGDHVFAMCLEPTLTLFPIGTESTFV